MNILHMFLKLLSLAPFEHARQHWVSQRITSIAIVILGLWFVYQLLFVLTSFDHPEVYAWASDPLNAIILLLLSLLLLVFYFYEKDYQTETINISRLSPILILIIFFIFTGEYIGFYFSTSIIFLTICYFYFPQKKYVKKLLFFLLIGTCFMTTIYFLFSFLLKVQVPRFFLF